MSDPTPSAGRIIRAYKHGWPRYAVDALIRHKLRRGLFAIRAQGLDEFRQARAEEPGGTVFLANHSCWWDVFLAHFLNETIPVDGYGMMEHFNLRRFGFFRRIGCFSVDRTDPASVREALTYAAGLLKAPETGLWIFPQGKILANDVRPLAFQGGLRALVRRAGQVRLVPVALRYEFWQEERPEAFVRFGTSWRVDRNQALTVVEDAERRLTETLDRLRADVLTQAEDRFETLFRGEGSIHDWFGRIHRRFAGETPGAPPLSSA